MIQQQRILVVDDEQESCDVLSEVLWQEGYIVETALSGPAALEHVVRSPADLVLTDYRMPGMDGVELIRRIRRRTPRQAAVLMSGCAARDLPGRWVETCIRKPMDLGELLWAIDCALACESQQAQS